MEGTMIWFNAAKRHGFIRTDDGERLRVDRAGFASAELLAGRCAGIRVRFERVAPPQDEPHAIDVAVVPLLASRRARLRGRGR